MDMIGFESAQLGFWSVFAFHFWVIILFYIQLQIFESQDYIFYLNYLFRQREKSVERFQRNELFRAKKILKRYIHSVYVNKRREKNIQALERYYKEKLQRPDADKSLLPSMFFSIKFPLTKLEIYQEAQQLDMEGIKQELNAAYDITVQELERNPSLQSDILTQDKKFVENLFSKR